MKTWRIVVGGIVAAVVGILVMEFSLGTFSGHGGGAPARAAAAVADPWSRADTVQQALALARPQMSDTYNEVSPAVPLLVEWGMKHFTWESLIALPVARPAMVMKDSDGQRGKVIRLAGDIIEIAAVNFNGGKVYDAGIASGGYIFRVAAVGDTGELVAGSRCYFCGIVIGRQDYTNSMGGTAHGIYLVGMFNLPVNHGPGSGRS